MDTYGILERMSGKSHVTLKDRGNTAIWDALVEMKDMGKKRVIIPDQGGWLTYPQFPPKLGFELQEIPTDRGLIDPKSLVELNENDVLLYEDPAGYFANQEIEEIYKVCKRQGCHVILDISGSIADNTLKKDADIIVGSFGRWKVIDAEYGGFVAADKYIGEDKYDRENLSILKHKLEKADDRLSYLYSIVANVKRDLKKYRIIHPTRQGLNVVVLYEDEKEKQELIEYCDKHSLEHTQCPRYIRVLDDAISIEIKRKI